MKKKLEAELISIAHRILQLKNRDDISQLQQETLKLYEKLSVLKFVEDNFSGAQPTITHAMAEEKLEEVYHLKEASGVKANEVEAEAAKEKAEKSPLTPQGVTEDKENKSGEGVDTDDDGKAPVAAKNPLTSEEVTEETAPAKEENADAPKEQPAEDKENKGGEGVDTDADDKAPVAAPEKKTEETPAPHEVKAAVIVVDAEVGMHDNIQPPVTEVPDMPAIGGLGEKDGEDKDNGAGEGVEGQSGKAAVSQTEKEYTNDTGPEFEKKPEPVKQKEISFEDFHDYKEPEFVKKDSPAPKDEAIPKAEEPEAETPKAAEPVRDWRDWEPAKSEPAKAPEPEQPKAEEPKSPEPLKDWRDWEPAKSEPVKAPEPEQPKAETPKPAAPPAPKFNDGFTRAISLTLNDRIAFEKQLFGGSSDDLNRVVSQLNTLNSYQDAQDFINDLVKPDYNNWAGKEEYEERFMAIVEKKFG